MRKSFLLLFSCLLAQSTVAYDYPLTQETIRNAYFFGRRAADFNEQFMSKYRRTIPTIKVESFVTQVKLETPFFQIADRTAKTSEYSAQDALKDFYDQPVAFRVYVDVCYSGQAAPPRSVKITILQNRKALVPVLDQRSGFFPPSDSSVTVASIGEHAKLSFDAQSVDSSTLTIRIDTPDGQSASVDFDMQELR